MWIDLRLGSCQCVECCVFGGKGNVGTSTGRLAFPVSNQRVEQIGMKSKVLSYFGRIGQTWSNIRCVQYR
jgi:hypothetical protein